MTISPSPVSILSSTVAGPRNSFWNHLRFSRGLAAACAATLLASHSAHAVNFEWDTNAVDTGAQGGTGIWDTTLTNFWNGTANVAWPTTGVDNDAIFGGTAGTVTVDTVSVNDLTFNTDGYSLIGGTLSIVAASTSASAVFTVGTGATASISSLIASPYDVTKQGAGTLTLSGGTSTTPSSVRQLFAKAGTLNITGFLNATTKFIVNGGTINWSGTGTGGGSYFGVGDGAAGTLNVTAGSLTANPTSGLFVGNTANGGPAGNLNVSGGSLTLASNVSFLVASGYNNTQATTTGVVTISGTGTLTTGTTTGAFQLGNNGGNAAINLDGGTLATSRSITRGTGTNGGSASGTFNFNGGTLRANGNNATFMNGLTAANVRNGGALIDSGAFNITIAQPLQHSAIAGDNAVDGGLTKNGSGILTLSGINSYTGTTTINTGTLIAAQPAALPGFTTASRIAVNAGSTLAVRAGGFDEWTSTDIDSLQTASNASFGAGSNLGIEVTTGNFFSYGTAISNGAGARGFVKLGGGTLYLDGANSYTGATTISGGTLSVSSIANGGTNSAIGASSSDAANLVLDGGTLIYTGTTASTDRGFSLKTSRTGTINIASADTTLTVTGDVLGTGNFYKAGDGKLILKGSNIAWNEAYPQAGTLEFDLGPNGYFTDTGKFAMNGVGTSTVNWKSGTGTIAANNYIALGDNSLADSTVNVSGGSLSFVNTAFRLLIGNTGKAAVNVSGGELIIGGGLSNVPIYIGGDNQYDADNAAGSLNVSGTGSVVINGTAVLVLGNNTGTKTGANGTINLDGGTLQTSRAITNGNGSGIVNFNGGTLKAGVESVTFLQGLTAANVKAGGAIIDTNGYNIVINQDLIHDGNLGATADGGLKKNGLGELSMGGASTYTGATIVSEGTLLVNGSISGTAKVNVSGTLGGAGSITPAAGALGDVNLLAGGTLSPGANGPGTLGFTFGGGSLDISAGVASANSQALVFDLGAPGTSDKIALTGGALTIGTGVLGFDDFAFIPLVDFNSAGTYTLFDGDTPIIGTLGTSLTGMINGQPFQLQLADNGRDIVLTSVPEPGSTMLLLAGVAGVLGFRRRGKSV